MTRRCLARHGLARCCLALAVLASGAVALASSASAGPRALVELFTSQGCSSCPAADRLLGELVRDPSLIAVSLSIDVWDYLGWKDTLADPRNTARWQGYAKSRGDRERYTPQAVVNGVAHALGSDRGAIEKAAARSQRNDAVMSVTVAAARDDDRLVVTLPEAPPGTAATVSVWGLAKAVTVAITRGENRGRTITYHNVVRRWINVGDWTAGTHRWNVALRDLAGEGVEAAAIVVQNGSPAMPSAVLGATLVPLR